MITVGIILFPQVEELDFIGPFEVLSYVNKLRPDSTKVILIAATTNPVTAFNGLRILPDTTFSDCPPLDILIAPGGKGRIVAMQSEAIKAFLHSQLRGLTFLTSVCTGAFLLAAAGLLNGKTATTYHTAFEELAAYGVTVTPSKVVRDGKIITAGGVSSGLELGFYLLRELFGTEFSQEVARRIEYAVDVKKL